MLSISWTLNPIFYIPYLSKPLRPYLECITTKTECQYSFNPAQTIQLPLQDKKNKPVGSAINNFT